MKKLILTLTVASFVVFTSCKENAAEKINQENVELKLLKETHKQLFFQPLHLIKQNMILVKL